MAWIESHSVLVDHRKVRECASILGIKKVHLIGHLHCFWHKVIDLAEDGVITDWTDEDISYYAQWDGDAKKFADALTGRFIDAKSGKKVVHDWLDYAWKYLYRKYHTANPKRLEDIQKIHKKIGKPKRETKGSIQVVLPNQPNLTNQPNLPKEEAGAKVSAFILPDWIDSTDWAAFEEMRKKIKKPMTDRARENIVKKLDAFKAKGHDPTIVLNNSITGGWQDVYEPKCNGGGNGSQNGSGKRPRNFAEEQANGRDEFRRKRNEAILRGYPDVAGNVHRESLERNRLAIVDSTADEIPDVEALETH